MDLTELSVYGRAMLLSLFTDNNFCFATATPDRSPTFYFARGGLASLNVASDCGRLRTSHRSGPLIDISTSPKQHIFFADLQRRNYVHANTKEKLNLNGEQEARAYADRVAAANRVMPAVNDYHWEFTKTNGGAHRISRRHASGGRIALVPRPNQNQITAILERLFEEGAAIQIDRRPVHNLQNVPRRRPVAGLAAYLNSL